MAYISGQLEKWPTKDQMAAILHGAGLRIYVGQYSIRLEDFPHFSFEEYGGDRGDPQVEADADTVADLIRYGLVVSDIFARAGLRHRFEIYDDDGPDPNVIAGYLHHEWPLPDSVKPPGPTPDATSEPN